MNHLIELENITIIELNHLYIGDDHIATTIPFLRYRFIDEANEGWATYWAWESLERPDRISLTSKPGWYLYYGELINREIADLLASTFYDIRSIEYGV